MAPPSSLDSQKTDSRSIYTYKPSLAASILFTVLYMFPFFYHFYLTVIVSRQSRTGASTKYRQTGYFVPLLIGAGFETIGYGLRCASVEQTDNVPLYSLFQTFIVVSPVFVCASMYLVIGRLIRRESGNDTGRKNRILCISSKWLPRLFISSDCFSFLLQGSGSGVASSGSWQGTTKTIGIDVIIGGLVLQVVTFSFFLVITVMFHRRILSQQRSLQAVGTTGGVRSSRGNVNTEEDFDSGVLVVIRGIYIAGSFVLVRSLCSTPMQLVICDLFSVD